MRLLSVDWDFFFPEPEPCLDQRGLYDWGRGENPLLTNIVWPFRAVAFLRAGLELPGTSGQEAGFWERFAFSESCKLFVAESHSAIYDSAVYSGVTNVISFDAHHDAGYQGGKLSTWIKKGRVACEDWVLAYATHGIRTHVVYPSWKTWAIREPKPVIDVPRRFDTGGFAGRFDRVFVCRSGAWAPSWLDDAFESFVAACPAGPTEYLGAVENRRFDLEEVRQFHEAETAVVALAATARTST